MSEPPPELIDHLERELGGHFSPEFLRPQVEVGTPVRDSTAEIRADLEHLRRTVAGIAGGHGLGLIAASTHPFARWRDQKHTDKPRYNILHQDMQVVAQRLLICGMHVHVGIEDDELRVDILNQVSYFLPHLLALSTSSPFWEGTDTGLQSYRLCVFDELPRTGLPERFESHDEYRRTVELMTAAGLIEDATKLWWDVRPSARFPTLEMRVTDVCTRLEDALCCTALFRCICRMLYRLRRDNQRWRIYTRTLVDENRWRAQRYGIDEGMVDFGRGEIVPFPRLMDELLGAGPGGRRALRLRRRGGARPHHRRAGDQLPHAGAGVPGGDGGGGLARGGAAGGGGCGDGGDRRGALTQRMGPACLDIDIASPARPEEFRTEQFLIDSGAVYSVVQGPVLEELGIEPHSHRTFTLANGDQIERPLGDALFRYNEHRGAAPVIFGEPGDSSLLGVVTLEALGYVLDPLKRELRPSPMLLAGLTTGPASGTPGRC